MLDSSRSDRLHAPGDARDELRKIDWSEELLLGARCRASWMLLPFSRATERSSFSSSRNVYRSAPSMPTIGS
jgi:hypothetical protein